MIKDVAQQLLQDENIWCGAAVKPSYLAECKQYLADMRYCDLPGEYMALLHYVNGVASDNAILFGVYPHDNDKDIIFANESWDGANKQLLLGQTDLDILLYDAEANDYQVQNKQDLSLAEVFDNLEDSLRYWFGLEG